LMGHWNDVSNGCQDSMDVPEIQSVIGTTFDEFPGCAELYQRGRLKYLDGHSHCNHVEYRGEKHADHLEVAYRGGQKEEDKIIDGFMIGGHGMAECGQLGFAFVDSLSSPGHVRVWYFEERNVRTPHRDDYPAILDCVKERGVAGCTHLATLWWESGGVSNMAKTFPPPQPRETLNQPQAAVALSQETELFD